MIYLVLAVGLNFHGWVQEASIKLQTPATVQIERNGSFAAWVLQCYGCNTVYVKEDFLVRATVGAQRIMAYHEVCHLFLMKAPFPEPGSFRYDVLHLAVDGCTKALLGPDFHRAMTELPCQFYFPDIALDYQQEIGKVTCEKRRDPGTSQKRNR
jgi:hypothetical protein